jgi:hypothetical protein
MDGIEFVCHLFKFELFQGIKALYNLFSLFLIDARKLKPDFKGELQLQVHLHLLI